MNNIIDVSSINEVSSLIIISFIYDTFINKVLNIAA